MPRSNEQEIQRLVRLVGNVTDAYTVALFLVVGRKNDQLSLAAYQSLSDNIIQDASIPVGHGLIGWVAKHEQQATAKKFRYNTKTLQFYSKDENIKSIAAVPIFSGDRLIGVLSVDSKQEYVFTDKKIKLLMEFSEMFSTMIAHGVSNLRLHSEAVNINTLSEIAEKAATCENISELAKMVRLNAPALIPHDYLVFAVRSLNDDEFRLVQTSENVDADIGGAPLPLTHYRLGWVIRQQRILYHPKLDAPVIPGDSSKWQSFIGAPIVANNSVSGAIGLMSRKPEAFRREDLKALGILASICSSTITSLYFHMKDQATAPRDSLTSTLTVQAMLESSILSKTEGGVAVIDLKHFGSVNRELGFAGGDKVLCDLAKRLESLIGETAVICRHYADKFILVFPDLSKAQIAYHLKGIVKSIESHPFYFQGMDINLTPVIGVAMQPDDGNGIEKLLIRAQEALEYGKQLKGSVIFFCGDPEPLERVHLHTVK